MVLSEGDLEQIGDKVQEITTEYWNMVEDRYEELITSVQESITELKILEFSMRYPTYIHERITEGRLIISTLVARLTQISAGDLQFKSAKIQ